MTIKSLVTFLFCSVAALSGCKKVKDDSKLKLTMNKSAASLPQTLASCSDLNGTDPTAKSLTAASLKLSKLTLVLDGGDSIDVQYFKIELNSGGMEGNTKTFVYDDFEATVGTPTLTIQPGATFTTSCEMRLGGIKIKDPTQDADITVTVTAVGHTLSEQEELITASTDIDVHYEGVR